MFLDVGIEAKYIEGKKNTFANYLSCICLASDFSAFSFENTPDKIHLSQIFPSFSAQQRACFAPYYGTGDAICQHSYQSQNTGTGIAMKYTSLLPW
jgi:hypothetical protein